MPESAGGTLPFLVRIPCSNSLFDFSLKVSCMSGIACACRRPRFGRECPGFAARCGLARAMHKPRFLDARSPMRTRAVCTPAVLLLLLSASAQAATKAGAKPGHTPGARGGGPAPGPPDSGGKRPTIPADAKGTLYVAFEGAGATAGGPSDVLFTASTDGGKTWSKPADLSNTPGATADPAIAVGKDGSIVVVWTDAGTENHPDIFAVRSTDGGKTWSKPADVSATPGVSS